MIDTELKEALGSAAVCAENPIWVETSEQLEEYAAVWLKAEAVAVDTEFVRTETFYPRPGLIQLSDGLSCYLLDPLTIDNFDPLRAVFQSPDVIKLFHASSEDLELFFHSYQVLPEPLYDTQVAAAFLGDGFSMGLQRLLESDLDVQVEKGETTSNWLKRPLTESQIHYAALDVVYLPLLFRLQRERLLAAGSYLWCMEECQQMLETARQIDQDISSYYLRFSQLWNLPDKERAGLRDLTEWRERTARERDLTRNRLLRNQSLISIAQRWPTDSRQLSAVPDVWRGVVKEHGATILSILAGADESLKANPPQPIPQPLHFKWSKQLKKLKAIARHKATDLGIAPELMLKKKELEQIIRSLEESGTASLPDFMPLWRQQQVGQALLNTLNSPEK